MAFPLERPLTLADCVQRAGLPAEISGDRGRLIKGVARLEDAGPGDLAFCNALGEDASRKVAASRGEAIIVHESFPAGGHRTVVRTKNPMLLFVRCLEKLFQEQSGERVSPRAAVHPEAAIGTGVAIGAFAVIERCCRLGRNVRVGPNSVIGGSGLAYARSETGEYEHFRHLGGVSVGDDVDIGANCAIVRGILQDTVIGDGTKIGNLVNIAHNVTIGRNCFVSAGATLCGSVHIEDDCWVAPGVVVLNHVRIGRGARVSLGAVVSRDVPAGATVAGFPARVLAKDPQ